MGVDVANNDFAGLPLGDDFVETADLEKIDLVEK